MLLTELIIGQWNTLDLLLILLIIAATLIVLIGFWVHRKHTMRDRSFLGRCILLLLLCGTLAVGHLMPQFRPWSGFLFLSYGAIYAWFALRKTDKPEQR